jgi:L-arabinose transport system ATP-binding protein
MSSPEPFLQFEAVSKIYPGVRALSDVSFGVNAGSVHALLGENGAGKSTLLKSLSGAHQPTSGTIRIGGVPRTFRNTSDAIAAGVAVIYQELHLVPEMSVAENLFLGHLPATAGFVNRAELVAKSTALLRRFGEDINPKTRLGRLPIGQRQMIEIAKALSRGARTIAFDEPTSSLSAREIDKLFAVIRDLKKDGCAILYVTHRMEEVYSLCDAATIFRDGRHVTTYDSLTGVTSDMIVKAMVGRELADVYRYSPRPHGEPALEVSGVSGPGVTAPASLSVAKGEILGLFGLVGAGRSELLRLICGATRKSGGHVRVWGKDVSIRGPRDAIREGLLFAPEDRKKDGIVPVRSVKENLNISARRKHAFLRTLINETWEKKNVTHFIAALGIRTPSPKQLISNLSGGNQQKVILARWLSEDVKVILLDEPTRGIDVGARAEIYSIIYDLAKSGVGVIVVSSDLPEVLGVSDRVLVMRQGKLAGEIKRENFNQEAALKLALPVSSAQEAVP